MAAFKFFKNHWYRQGSLDTMTPVLTLALIKVPVYQFYLCPDIQRSLPSNVMILRDVLVYNYRSIFIPIDRNLGTNFVENLIWNAELKYAICSVYKNKKWNFKVHRFEEAITIVDNCFTRIKKIYRDKRPLILCVCNTTKYNDYSPVFLRFNNVK